MIGAKQFEIGMADFIQGMTSSAAVQDGGFSNECDQVNIAANPGILYAPALSTDKSTASSGDLIASCEDPATSGTLQNRMFVSATGKYFAWTGSTLSLIATDTTSSASYQSGTTDMVSYVNNIYTTRTNDGDITQWGGTADFNGTVGRDKSWWITTCGKTALSSGVRHPMIVFNKILYIADKNVLYSYDGTSNTTVISTVLTLSAEQVITALGIDPGSGKMLVGVSVGQNYSAAKYAPSYIGLYDGFSPSQFSKKIYVDDQINAFYNVGGTVFVTYSQNLGFFNGTGIAFLRKLKNVTFTGQALPYKHHITNIGSTLYVIDGQQVLAYGDILKGQKAFYYAFTNPLNSNKFDVVANVGSNVLGIAVASGKFYTFDTSSTATISTMNFYSKRYYFPRPIFIRQIVVEFNESISNSAQYGGLYIIDQKQNINFVSNLQNTTGATAYGVTTQDTGLKVTSFQLRLNNTNINIGVRRCIVYYDVAE